MFHGPVFAEAGVETAPPRARATLRPAAWLPGWGLAAVILCGVFGPSAVRLDLIEPDNAMRLVQVRDLMAGQVWFDLTQHRMGEAGASMHWARWIDALIAAPIALLAPVIGPVQAEAATSFAWPLGLLAVFMALVSGICRDLAADPHKSAAALVGPLLAALAFPAMDRFAPGSFDHHNLVAVMLAAGLLGLLRMKQRPVWGLAAGGSLAAALGAAAEALPFVAAGAAGAGLAWLVRPQLYGRGLVWFGAGLAASGLAFFLIQVPPPSWGAPVCDAMSRAYLGFAVLAGAGACGLGLLGDRRIGATFGGRLALAGALALSAATLMAAFFPECRSGGYGAVSDAMDTLWMAQIAEARSIIELAGDDIALLFGLAGGAGFGLFAMAWAVRREPICEERWIAGAFLLMAAAVMTWQVRGAALAAVFAVPFATLLVVHMRAAYRGSRSPRALLAFAGAAALSASAVWSAIGVQVRAATASQEAVSAYQAASTDARACMRAQAYAGLAGSEPGLVINEFALGPAVLLHTPHAVLAGPYHRNEAGTLAAIDLFRSEAGKAEAIFRAAGARYVLVCEGSSEAGFYAQHPMSGTAPRETLASRLSAGAPPSWLTPVPIGDGPLRFYEAAAPGATAD